MENVYSVSCRLTYDPAITINDSMVETQFHYIVQESITNAIRHGRADRITVSLKKKRGIVHLEIEDDGTGIPDDVDPAEGHGSPHHAVPGECDRRDHKDREKQAGRDHGFMLLAAAVSAAGAAILIY